MLAHRVAAVLAVVLATPAVAAEHTAITASDLVKLEQIARDLVGIPIVSDRRIVNRLGPYLRTRDELNHIIILSANQHGYITIRLRDDFTFNYMYLHIPTPGELLGDDDNLTADVMSLGNNRIEQVTIVRRGKIVFSVETSRGRAQSRI